MFGGRDEETGRFLPGVRNGGHEAGTVALEQHRQNPAVAGRTHGAHSRGHALALVCGSTCPVADRCPDRRDNERCAVEVSWLARKARQLRKLIAQDGGNVIAAEGSILIYLDAGLRIGRIQRALAAVGDFVPGGTEAGFAEPQPVLKLLPRFYKAMQDAEDALLLSPKARRQLGDGGGGPDLGALVREAAEREARERAEAQAKARDAEFDEGDGEEAGEA